jgi:hypothetical protein
MMNAAADVSIIEASIIQRIAALHPGSLVQANCFAMPVPIADFATIPQPLHVWSQPIRAAHPCNAPLRDAQGWELKT